MNILNALPLLAGLSPQQFMQRHWQKKPLLIRQALPGFRGLLTPRELFALAGTEGVESRLVVQTPQGPGKRSKAPTPEWRLSHGPFQRRALPAISQAQWTLLVQGVDLHHPGMHALLQQFRFVPDARLDDVMVSFATTGGGVGPHFDSYDVFLLQAHGQRRWRIGRQKDFQLVDDVPLKILAHFEPEQEFVLDPGDMLYLPPRYAHDGVALGECMTYSIGFRAPEGRGLAVELLQRMVDELEDDLQDATQDLYRDPRQPAVLEPARIPESLADFAAAALRRALKEGNQLARLLGENLTEPKRDTRFPSGSVLGLERPVALDPGTRMMFDAQHVFINGESYRAGGRDATLMRLLANSRELDVRSLRRASPDALTLLGDWCEAGWLHAFGEGADHGGA
jgi:50S ribosomal protein L16 3-hydroxylase